MKLRCSGTWPSETSKFTSIESEVSYSTDRRLYQHHISLAAFNIKVTLYPVRYVRNMTVSGGLSPGFMPAKKTFQSFSGKNQACVGKARSWPIRVGEPAASCSAHFT